MTSCFLPRLRGLLFLGPLFLGAVPLLAGCGIPPAPDRNEDGAIAAGRGRIYFYRTTLSLGGPNSLLGDASKPAVMLRSEEHTSELQSLMHISYAVFCLKKNTIITNHNIQHKTRKP